MPAAINTVRVPENAAPVPATTGLAWVLPLPRSRLVIAARLASNVTVMLREPSRALVPAACNDPNAAT